jgi:hypothetical protein
MASEPIKGTVGGVNPQDYKVVIYARNGDKWWVQPTAASPQTHIVNDGKWESETQGGTEFAALLVKGSDQPEAVRGMIPGVGGGWHRCGKEETVVHSATTGSAPRQVGRSGKDLISRGFALRSSAKTFAL